MQYGKAVRLSIVGTALFPTMWGLLSLLNNATGFKGTAEFAILPVISMADTFNNPAQTWRGINSLLVAQIFLVILTALETLIGVLGAVSMLKMTRALNAPYRAFEKAKSWFVLSCALGIIVWGVGFAVVAGDYFLNWQSKGGITLQINGMLYALPCFLGLILAVAHRNDDAQLVASAAQDEPVASEK